MTVNLLKGSIVCVHRISHLLIKDSTCDAERAEHVLKIDELRH